jgi:hypothetical protein
MPPFQGRLQVGRLKQGLDETFARVDAIDTSKFELRSDMARYLCVLVTGYVELAVQELTIEWCRRQSSPSVTRYASGQLRRIQNVNGRRLKDVLGFFESTWRQRVESEYSEEVDALDSLYGNRHLIAHGSSVGLTVVQMHDYYERVQRIVDLLVELMDPAPETKPTT